MTDSEAFERVCEQLESASSLDRLEARGTIRLILRKAGLEARSTTASQLSVAVSKLLPDELKARGIEDVETLCGSLSSALATVRDEPAGDSPESVFQRLGGGVQ